MSLTNERPDLIARARDAWGKPPEWVLVLAEACMEATQTAVADEVGYSPSVIGQAIANTYQGDMSRVEARVRGALMKEKVRCPVLVEVTRDECLNWQKKPFSTASGLNVKMHRACRAGCPNSRLN
ncbi:MAG: transcriptional regulator [Pseudomonadota bacterium]